MTTAIGSPPAAPAKPLISAVEFEKMSGTRGFELLDGVLVEKQTSFLSGLVGATVLRLLGEHCARTKSGCVLDSEGGYRCFPEAPNRIRKPDASFVAIERMPASAIPAEGYPNIPPDLAVEVISPNDLFHEVTEKIQQYLAAGVRRVWVIDPETRTVEIRRPDGSNTLLLEADELSGEDVVVGFRCRVGDLFPPRP